jgi:hypothetical protein
LVTIYYIAKGHLWFRLPRYYRSVKKF